MSFADKVLISPDTFIRSGTRAVARSLFYLFLAILVTYPLVFQISDHLLGHPDVDVWNHVWGFWWTKVKLLEQHHLPLYTEMLGYPRGGRLYFIDPLNGLLSIPLQLLFGLVVAYNLTLLGELALAGLATHLLAREAGSSEQSAYLAGALVALSPILRNELHNGISEVGNVGWLALSLLFTYRALESTRARDAALAGLMMAVAFVACWYYGMAAGGAGILMWLMRVSWRPPYFSRLLSHWKAYFLWALCMLVVAIPFWISFSWTLEGTEAIIQRAPAKSAFLLRHNATDLLSFFMPGDYHEPNLKADYGEAFLHTTYLGWVALLVALFAIKERAARVWLVTGFCFAILALGPYLFVNGDFLRLDGKLLRLPFMTIFRGLGLVAITHPGRMVVVSLLCLAVVSALGLDRIAQLLPTTSRLAMPLALCALGTELLLFAPAPYPLTLARANYGACTQVLARDPVPGPVLDLPGLYYNTMRTSRYLFDQTGHRRPIPYVVNVRPEAALGFRHDRLYRWLLRLGTEQDEATLRELRAVPKSELERGFMEQFRIPGYRFVVIHRDIIHPPWGVWPYRRLFDQLLGPPEATKDGCWIYKIDP